MELKELVEEIKNTESGESFKLLLSDDDTITVGYADCWIGGEGCKGWMCDMLGNTCYQSAETLAEEIFSFVENELKLTIEDFDF